MSVVVRRLCGPGPSQPPDYPYRCPAPSFAQQETAESQGLIVAGTAVFLGEKAMLNYNEDLWDHFLCEPGEVLPVSHVTVMFLIWQPSNLASMPFSSSIFLYRSATLHASDAAVMSTHKQSFLSRGVIDDLCDIASR